MSDTSYYFQPQGASSLSSPKPTRIFERQHVSMDSQAKGSPFDRNEPVTFPALSRSHGPGDAEEQKHSEQEKHVADLIPAEEQGNDKEMTDAGEQNCADESDNMAPFHFSPDLFEADPTASQNRALEQAYTWRHLKATKSLVALNCCAYDTWKEALDTIKGPELERILHMCQSLEDMTWIDDIDDVISTLRTNVLGVA
ncbi:hypothetical protein B0I35DRAFT_464071 [Stachybotrys elegans]|uniref:Uncharacterized protein n=1 Tax=Stachybotrys elegans TaxID=80388 RepID=A0A8K0SKY8_9HYPO|nr:hypothetical protein B0I35DRAFT_464071 [Stachybotrys elegans]